MGLHMKLEAPTTIYVKEIKLQFLYIFDSPFQRIYSVLGTDPLQESLYCRRELRF